MNRAQNENETKYKLNENVEKTLNSIFRDLDDVLQRAKSESTIAFPEISTDNRKDFIIDAEDKDIDISETALQTKITTSKKFAPKKRSSYFLHKRKGAFLESADALSNEPLIQKSIPDQEFDKIKATESIVDSNVKQLPDKRIQNLFKTLQKDSKSVFYASTNLSNNVLKKLKKKSISKRSSFC